ncbi:MAG: glycosyltransferase family 4 protein [Hyphomicrobium sp.]|nr:glycosyltransferase family 4 protein [Hyphomicrobium sp.]
MRILHCLRAPVGGLFRHVLDLAAEQARLGHDVGILADSNAEDRLTSSKFDAVAPLLTLGILRTPMSRNPGLGDVQAYRTVLAHARTLNLDVLHGHGAKGGAYARLAVRALKHKNPQIKSFYTPHGGSLHFKPGTAEAKIFLGLERILERYSTGVIFESAYAARVYAERVRVPSVPIRVIPNGLQPADFELAQPGNDAKDLLFVGELRHLKGIDVLIDAIAALQGERKVTAAIVGSGPDGDALKAKAEALGLPDLITFTGALPARLAFNLGRVMVVPSLAESFPYVVLEAAAAGLPLISTNVGGIPEIVAGTDTGLIAPGNVPALSTALRETLSIPAAAAAKAKRLRDNVAAKFTVSGMTSAVLDFYASANR